MSPILVVLQPVTKTSPDIVMIAKRIISVSFILIPWRFYPFNFSHLLYKVVIKSRGIKLKSYDFCKGWV